jgi:hypothetical protein
LMIVWRRICIALCMQVGLDVQMRWKKYISVLE